MFLDCDESFNVPLVLVGFVVSFNCYAKKSTLHSCNCFTIYAYTPLEF